MRTFTLVFDGSGTDEKTLPRGTFFLILATTSSLSLKVFKDGSEIASMSGSALQQGISWESLDEQGNLRIFDEIRVNSAVAQSMQIGVGLGRLSNDAPSGNVTATIVKNTTLDSLADVSLAAGATTLIAAADATRRKLRVGSLTGNVNIFRIGDNGAGAANGEELAPGEWKEIETSGAVYGFNPGGAAQSVSVVAIKD